MSWIKAKTCYAIMPFSFTATRTQEQWTDVFENLFKPTLESLGYQCTRSEASVGLILKGIIESIHASEVMLVDLTDAKPNVFYELGIAHTMTNNVIMVIQDLSYVPSDLKPYGVIPYDPRTKEGVLQFARDLSGALRKILQKPPTRASPIYEFLGKTHRFLDNLATNPVAFLQCAKCHQLYEVPINGMSQGMGEADKYGPQLCGHWEPAIFRGLKGIQTINR